MAAPTPVLQINHTIIPSAAPYQMGIGGTFIAKPAATLRQNGLGIDVVAGYASVNWTWDYLSISDYLWWNTILLGQASFQYSHALLWDHASNLIAYSNIVVHRPTFGHVKGDVYYEVAILLDQLY